jgi:lysophospholipase L1-like esterase
MGAMRKTLLAESRSAIHERCGVFAIAVVCLGLHAGCSSPNDDPVGGPGAIVPGSGGTGSGGITTGGSTGASTSSGGTTSGGSTSGGSSAVSAGGAAPSGSGGVATGGSAGSNGTDGGIDGSTDAGGDGAGGSAGSGDYRPCPTNGDACKILPLGDSITWGLQYDGAYRVELFTKAVGAGKKITFTGSQRNGPNMVAGQTFPKNNEGHSGWTITRVAGLVPSPALDTPPHIVLLHIGTNDVYASGEAMMGDRLGSLIDKITSAAPSALVVVAKIVPLSGASRNATIKTFNDGIPALVQKRAAQGKHVMVVDLNTGFTPSMLSTDGVHPNKSGYDFMGDRWYAAISDLLP